MIEIRPANHDDFLAVWGLYLQLVKVELENGTEMDMDPALMFQRSLSLGALLSSHPSQGGVLLALVDGEPAGFLAVTRGSLFGLHAVPALHIEGFYVRPDFRKDGIGGKLLNRLRTIVGTQGPCRIQWASSLGTIRWLRARAAHKGGKPWKGLGDPVAVVYQYEHNP